MKFLRNQLWLLMIFSAVLCLNSCKDENIDDGNFSIPAEAPRILSITPNDSSPSSNMNAIFTVVFSDIVYDVQVSDFQLETISGSVSGSIVDASSTDQQVYSVTTSLTGTGEIRLNADDSDKSIYSIGTQGNTEVEISLSPKFFNSTDSLTIIAAGSESVISINRGVVPATNPTSSTSLEFDITFSGPVTNVAISDFVVTNTGSGAPSITNVVGAGANWTASVSSTSVDGAVGLNLNDADSSILDGSSDPLGVTTHTSDQLWTVDSSSPSVLFINRGSAPATNPTSITSLEFMVNFSENVSPVVAGDFIVTNTGTGAPSITSVSGGPSIYIVTVDATGVNGDVGLDLGDFDSSIMDMTSNGLAPNSHVGDQTWTKNP